MAAEGRERSQELCARPADLEEVLKTQGEACWGDCRAAFSGCFERQEIDRDSKPLGLDGKAVAARGVFWTTTYILSRSGTVAVRHSAGGCLEGTARRLTGMYVVFWYLLRPATKGG